MLIPPRPTLKDVARLAGTSIAAASMILRGRSGFSPATVSRVQAAAAKLAYKPDPALSALAAYRSGLKEPTDFSVLAMVTNWATRDAWTHMASAQKTIAGAQARAVTLGYKLEPFWAEPSTLRPRRLADILASRGIRGVILAPLRQPQDLFSFPWEEFSVVTIERPQHYPLLHHVVSNYHGDMCRVWERLLAAGYRRPGLAMRNESAHRSASQWESAHLHQQTQHLAPKARVPNLVLRDDETDVQATSDWLLRHQPDVVIGRNANILQAAKLARIRVPEEMGYISLNVLDDEPAVTGVLQNRETIGALAVDLLNALLLRNHRGFNAVPQSTEVDSDWAEGTTLRARATRHQDRSC